jgi:hypothetical protein
MTRADSTSPALVRRHTTAALLAAVVIFGGSAHAAIASADATWDLEMMDRCFAHGPTDVSNDETWLRYHECCIISGGVWQATGEVTGKCVAPPAQGSSQNQQTPSEVDDNPQVAPPPPAAPPRRDPSRIPFDNAPISPGPS